MENIMTIKKQRIFIPALIVLFAVVTFVISQNVAAQEDTGENLNKTIPKITGTISASGSYKENLDKVKFTFSEIATIAQNAVTDGKVIDGRLGTEQGYLVYKFSVVDSEEKIHKVIVDAGSGNVLYTSDGRSLDEQKSYEHGDKWSHHEMMSKFGHVSPDEKAQKFTQFKEMKEAFSALSADDQATIKSQFKDMKMQYKDLSKDGLTQKRLEHKAMMDEFTKMSLDEKIQKLHQLAESIRAQK